MVHELCNMARASKLSSPDEDKIDAHACPSTFVPMSLVWHELGNTDVDHEPHLGAMTSQVHEVELVGLNSTNKPIDDVTPLATHDNTSTNVD